MSGKYLQFVSLGPKAEIIQLCRPKLGLVLWFVFEFLLKVVYSIPTSMSVKNCYLFLERLLQTYIHVCNYIIQCIFI